MTRYDEFRDILQTNTPNQLVNWNVYYSEPYFFIESKEHGIYLEKTLRKLKRSGFEIFTLDMNARTHYVKIKFEDKK